ncbi:MAG TPA: sigma 54-interacting transcriptional regulator [Verrucomicrobiae bacterium]|nr:sigma 54-interacting transcriptional regulator [Verrucomicrobiae bacterium]
MTTSAISSSAGREAGRYERLLRAANFISACGDCEAATGRLIRELHEIVSFDYLQVVSLKGGTNEVAWQFIDIGGVRDSRGPLELSELPEGPLRHVHERGEVLLVNRWADELQFSDYAQSMADVGVVSSCILPLKRGERRIGLLCFGKTEASAFVDDVQFLGLVADQIALAIDAAVNFFVSRRAEDRLKLILDLTNQVVANLDFKELLRITSANIRGVMACDAAAIMLAEEDGKSLRVHALDFPDSRGIFVEGVMVPVPGTMPGDAFRTGKPMVINRLDSAELPPEMYNKAKAEGLNSFCDVPLISRQRILGILAVARHEENTFDTEEVLFLSQAANQVAIAVENALAYGEISELKDKLAQEKLYLEEELRGEMDFEGIVGQSSALRRVLQLVETVAPSDSTVLLLGETGTGKELIARAIHDRSRRKDRTFVKINCAAIPTGLLESELFGHERGAFTGAITQKIGRLELADQGSLFLDEVGDIPIEIQPKLLRALQEREFERLGSTRTKKVDVRLVAATNRNLEKMIEDREFRQDLYYRLNVFPIRIPPLRDRPEDIPLLVRYFAQKYGRRMEKRIESVPTSTMKKLSRWQWPGNIRELENFIERSVILTHGSALQVPVGELTDHAPAVSIVASTDSAERDQIVQILKQTSGRVAGPNGAAARLGIKRTTLISRMKKLGIDSRRAF